MWQRWKHPWTPHENIAVALQGSLESWSMKTALSNPLLPPNCGNMRYESIWVNMSQYESIWKRQQWQCSSYYKLLLLLQVSQSRFKFFRNPQGCTALHTQSAASHISVPCDCLKLLLETCRRVSGEKPCKSSSKISKWSEPCGELSHDTKPWLKTTSETSEIFCEVPGSSATEQQQFYAHCIQAARSEELSPEAWTVDISLEISKSNDVVRKESKLKRLQNCQKLPTHPRMW